MARRISLEAIEWLDHSSYSENHWKNGEEAEQLTPLKVTTVGWVIKETKKYVTLINTIIPKTKKYKDEMCIVKGAIKKRTEIDY